MIHRGCRCHHPERCQLGYRRQGCHHRLQRSSETSGGGYGRTRRRGNQVLLDHLQGHREDIEAHPSRASSPEFEEVVTSHSEIREIFRSSCSAISQVLWYRTAKSSAVQCRIRHRNGIATVNDLEISRCVASRTMSTRQGRAAKRVSTPVRSTTSSLAISSRPSKCRKSNASSRLIRTTIDNEERNAHS